MEHAKPNETAKAKAEPKQEGKGKAETPKEFSKPKGDTNPKE